MWLDDLATVYGSVATLDVNMFLGAKPVIPNGDGPYLVIKPTSGTSPDWIQNTVAPAHEVPGAQVLLVGMDAQATGAMAYLAWLATTKWNTPINNVLYRSIKPVQSPFELPMLDAKGRSQWVFNVLGDKAL